MAKIAELLGSSTVDQVGIHAWSQYGSSLPTTVGTEEGYALDYHVGKGLASTGVANHLKDFGTGLTVACRVKQVESYGIGFVFDFGSYANAGLGVMFRQGGLQFYTASGVSPLTISRVLGEWYDIVLRYSSATEVAELSAGGETRSETFVSGNWASITRNRFAIGQQAKGVTTGRELRGHIVKLAIWDEVVSNVVTDDWFGPRIHSPKFTGIGTRRRLGT